MCCSLLPLQQLPSRCCMHAFPRSNVLLLMHLRASLAALPVRGGEYHWRVWHGSQGHPVLQAPATVSLTRQQVSISTRYAGRAAKGRNRKGKAGPNKLLLEGGAIEEQPGVEAEDIKAEVDTALAKPVKGEQRKCRSMYGLLLPLLRPASPVPLHACMLYWCSQCTCCASTAAMS